MNPCNPELLLPPWMQEHPARQGAIFPTAIDRMRLAIELGRENIIHKTGGPFGAAIFERHSGRLVAAGVNLVVRSNCSLAHAEMVALALAQRRLASYTLNRPGLTEYELVSSCEPCAMCFGALIWAGITSLACGASSEDARQAGFDEGPKPAEWIAELNKRGITVVEGLCRNEARALLKEYTAIGGVLYNARPSSP